jgi:DNA-directed RNA polymerase subunit RPC12/RpoP
MAEVIGEDPTAGKEISCRGCGARVRYYQKDMVWRTSYDYDGSSDRYSIVKCPRCEHEIHV